MANPIISRTTLATSAVAMSVRGVVSKTAFLLSLAAVSGFGVFFMPYPSMSHHRYYMPWHWFRYLLAWA